jgi:hypothetical protein
MSRSFTGKPVRQHLVAGKRGIGGEVHDLRRDVETAFETLETELDTPYIVHESMVAASRSVTRPNQGPTYYTNGVFIGLQFALGTDEAFRTFKIPSNFSANPAMHIHWTKSGDQNEQNRFVRWSIDYLVFNAIDQDVVVPASTVEYEGEYLSSGTTSRVVYRSPNLPLVGFVAGYYVSLRVRALTPAGLAMQSQPVLFSADLMYSAVMP